MNLNIVKPNLPLRLSLYNTFKFHMKQAVVQGCSVKKLFLEISQNSQENTGARVSFLSKKRPWHRCFPINFKKFLRTPFFTEHLFFTEPLWWLVL